MKTVVINNIPFLTFTRFASCSSLQHAVSTRRGGISPEPFTSLNLGLNTADAPENVRANHEIIGNALGFSLHGLVSSRQVHGCAIKCIAQHPVEQPGSAMTYTFSGFDALITDVTGIMLMVRVADCVPLLLFDEEKKVLAVVHAGWKGTLAGIAGKTVQTMIARYGSLPGNILAGIGPAIGPCCFTVGSDVAERFYTRFSNAALFVKKSITGFVISLGEANRLQLISRGCGEHNIETAGLCTACMSDMFFSHRREQGKTGRFGLLAGLTA